MEDTAPMIATGFSLLKETFDEWNKDKAPRLAAALAYYTAFSIAPLLIIVIAVAGLAFGQEAAEVIQTMIDNSSNESTGIVATVLGLITIIFGAIGFFSQLEDALNTVWSVETKSPGGLTGIGTLIKDRLLSFTLVVDTGFLMLVSLIISAVLASLNGFVEGLLPQVQFLTQLINIVISFGVITLLFAVIYKVLPDAIIAWRDVWVGAAITALLFTIGKFLLGLYLGNSSIGSTYGAAGSFVVLLLWVYYSAQILLFGAEFTQVYAQRYGSRILSQTILTEGNAEPKSQQSREAENIKEELVVLRPPVEVVLIDDLGVVAKSMPDEVTRKSIPPVESQTNSPQFPTLLIGLAVYNTLVAGLATLVFSLRGSRQSNN